MHVYAHMYAHMCALRGQQTLLDPKAEDNGQL